MIFKYHVLVVICVKHISLLNLQIYYVDVLHSKHIDLVYKSDVLNLQMYSAIFRYHVLSSLLLLLLLLASSLVVVVVVVVAVAVAVAVAVVAVAVAVVVCYYY